MNSSSQNPLRLLHSLGWGLHGAGGKFMSRLSTRLLATL